MNAYTKIIATIGPACDSEEMIRRMIEAGVNVFRFNFKHNTIEWHNERIIRVNEVAKHLGALVGTLIDLQGPEIRISMNRENLKIKKDDVLVFGETSQEAGKTGFTITHPQIIEHLKDGQKIVADNGAFIFHIEKKGGGTYLRSSSNGLLLNHKSINIPGADFPFPTLVDRDFEGLKLAQKNAIDYIALSFVRSAYDVQVLRREMEKYRVEGKIIAKIETEKALDHLASIIRASDGIMVARGDMGVELPIEQVPYYQKIIIKETIRQGKPVITATQMLQSMTAEPYPTRAEVSDIANAVYDLTDAVMLSGESAMGAYPVESVDMMRKTIAFHEKKNTVDSRLRFTFDNQDVESMLSDTAYGLYRAYSLEKKNLCGFLVFTQTGRTAKLLSRYRPLAPIFAFAPSKKVADSLTINFGVVPLYHAIHESKQVDAREINTAIEFLKKHTMAKKGQMLIVLHGDYWAKVNGTSTVTLLTIE